MKTTSLTILLTAIAVIGTAQTTYLQCGRLIDGVSSAPATEMTILVRDGVIHSVEHGYTDGGPDDEVVDLRNKTVLPGLMDMHVHIEGQSSPRRYLERFTLNEADVAFRAAGYAKNTLMAGFTTVRDLGGSGVNIALRNAINSGITEGPRIFTCGKAIGTTGGHADPTNGARRFLFDDPGPEDGVINGVEDAQKAVRQRYKDGADCIKISATGGVLSVSRNGENPQFFQEEIEAIVRTARDYEMTTAAHAHGAEGMKRAVLAGITSIEHGTKMTEEVIDLMIEHGTYYVPTISAGETVMKLAQKPGYFPAIIIPKAMEMGPIIKQTFARAYQRGVTIAFGTDAGVFPHGENWQEFIYMHEAGMPAMECLHAATITPARMLGIDDTLGSIESGKKADIIAVDGNPLEDIKVMQNVTFVMKDGVVYKGGNQGS